MRYGLDTNVLIYAHIPTLPDHTSVRSYLLEKLSDPDVAFFITPAILHEFIHVVTDARRFEPPLKMGEAIAVARLYLGRTNVSCVPTDEKSVLHCFELLERYRLGRKRLADTLFAATLMRYEVAQLITCNPRDFTIFEELAIVDPRMA